MARGSFPTRSGGGGAKPSASVRGGTPQTARRGIQGGTSGLPIEELEADVLRVKKVHYDQVRAIAMAPKDGIGTFGWTTLGGLIASLPATAQDIWASYISKHPVALPPGRLIDILISVGFFVALCVSVFRPKEATSSELLSKLFPEKISADSFNADVVVM